MSESSGRWSTTVPVAGVLTEEQAQRVQAVRAAREVVEFKNSASSAFTSPSISVDVVELLVTAEWIITGSLDKIAALNKEEEQP